MQQYAQRAELGARIAEDVMVSSPSPFINRTPRLLILTLLWVASALTFVGVAVGFASLLQRAGMHPKYAELLLGLTYFPLYLIVRRVWTAARQKLLAAEFDTFLKAQGITG